LLLSAGQPKQAEAQLKIALKEEPGFPEAHLNLGIAYEHESFLDAATAQFRRAVQIDPALVQAYCELGKTLLRQGNLDAARQNFETALRLNPDLGEPHYQLARVLQAQGHGQRAGEEFEQVKTLNRLTEKITEAVQLNNQGLDLAAKGDFKKAVRVVREATELVPDLAMAHYNLGLVLADSGDFKSASRELRTAIFLRPCQAIAHYELGRVLQRIGDASGAMSELEWAAKRGPADKQIAELARTEANRTAGLGPSPSAAKSVSTPLFTAKGLDDLGMSMRR